MESEIKYTHKEVKLSGALTEKGRKASLDKKIKKMAKDGWEIVEHIDGGATKTSKATFKRDINYQAPKKDNKGIKKIFKYALYLLLGFILLGIIGSMLPKVELTPEQKEKIAIEKQEKIIEQKKQDKKTGEYANKILNVVFSDILRNEKHLQDFLITLSKNNVLNTLEQSKQYNRYASKWAMKSYTKAEVWGAKEDELVDSLVDEVRNLALFHQIYYDSVDKYFDNPIPSNLLKIKQNMKTISDYKIIIMTKAFSLANKYNLEYNEKKNIWYKSKE